MGVVRLGPYKLGPNDTPENGIYTGDARELAKAIPDESVDLVLTDPPFGIDFDYGGTYDDDPQMYRHLLDWIVEVSNRVVRPGGLCFVYVAQPQLYDIWPGAFPEGSRLFAACKNFVQMRPTPVQFAFDPVVFWRKDGPRLKPDSGRDWHVANTCITNSRGLNEAGWHPCPRPLDTVMYMVEHFSPVDGIVVDWFCGSATTALACHLLRRHWWSCEIVDEWAQLARDRVRQTQPPLFVPEPGQAEMDLG